MACSSVPSNCRPRDFPSAHAFYALVKYLRVPEDYTDGETDVDEGSVATPLRSFAAVFCKGVWKELEVLMSDRLLPFSLEVANKEGLILRGLPLFFFCTRPSSKK